MLSFRSLIGAASACLALSACASTEAAREANDPFEPVNRAVYGFNNAVDDAVVGPVARGYLRTAPEPVQASVNNFVTNLNQPVVLANLLLQGELNAAGETVGRIFLNTVFGIGGIFDVASAEDIPLHAEDFGQTLGVWGAPEGPFIMLPVLGPSSVRDGIGRLGDRYPHPLNWNADFSQSVEAWSVRGLHGLNARANLEDALESLDRAAIDPYVQVRSSWRQARDAQIRNEASETDDFEDLPDFD